MADTYSIEKLSGSTEGRPIALTGASSGAAVTLHTAVASANDIDVVTLWAVNNNASATRTVTVEWGTSSDPIVAPVPAKAGLVQITPPIPILNGQVIEAFADVANEVAIFGIVSRANKP